KAGAPGHMVELSHEAQRFVMTYASNPISDATPHIYISAFPLCTRSSPLLECYRQKLQGLIEVDGTVVNRVEQVALATWASKGVARSLCYSPDGTRIGYLIGSGVICVRDAANGRIIAEKSPLEEPKPQDITGDPRLRKDIGSGWMTARKLTYLWFSHDGGRIYTCDSKGSFLTWSSADLAPMGSPFDCPLTNRRNDNYILGLGTHRIVACWDQETEAWVWDLINGRVFATINLPRHWENGRVVSLAVSPNDARVAIGKERIPLGIQIWDISTKAPIYVVNLGLPDLSPLHIGLITRLAFSSDSMRVVASISQRRSITVWDACVGTLLLDLPEAHDYIIHSVSFSPGGEHILSCSKDLSIKLWDSSTGSPTGRPLIGHADSINSAIFSPDGSRIISSSDDCTIRVWVLSTPVGASATETQAHNGIPTSAHFSPDGVHIISGFSDSKTRVWEANNGKPALLPFEGHTQAVTSISVSPDGTRIASGSKDQCILVWDTRTGLLVSGPFEGHSDWVNSLQFSPNGACIASGSEDRTIRLWDASSGALLKAPLEGHSLGIKTVAFSPNGALLASGGEDRSVWLWVILASDSRVVGTKTLGRHTHKVNQVTFSPDGLRLASASNDCTIRLWDPNTGSLVFSPLEGRGGAVSAIAFSCDGLYLVSGSENGSVQLWNAASGTLLSTFEGHTKGVTTVDFSPDGAYIISGSLDQSIRLSKLESTLPAHSALASPWTIRSDSWIVNALGHLLFWLPADMLAILPQPFNGVVI
ncbi:hypothetical protein FRC11_012258, partial [Ceratobasidium sp. 423]